MSPGVERRTVPATRRPQSSRPLALATLLIPTAAVVRPALLPLVAPLRSLHLLIPLVARVTLLAEFALATMFAIFPVFALLSLLSLLPLVLP